MKLTPGNVKRNSNFSTIVLTFSILEGVLVLFHWCPNMVHWPYIFKENFFSRIKLKWGSILWFPIPPLPDKTFWKFSDFHSENGLKSILTIIVMGNRQRFTSFCFWSWFLENEMLPDKTFWQRIQICIICWWSAALWWCILMSTGLYWTIFNQKSRIRW